MKSVLLKLLFLFFYFNSAAQSGIERSKKIKLIYDSIDLQKIIPPVDKLNAEFEKKVPRKYYAIKQARAIYVQLGNISNLNAIYDLDKNMPLEAFIQKYPKAKVKRNVLVLQELDTDFAGDTTNHFSYIDPLRDNNFLESFDVYDIKRLPANYKEDSTYDWRVKDYDVKTFPENYKDKFVYYFHGGYDEPEYNYIQAFYFLEDMTTPEIPAPYARMIDYKETIFDPAVKVYNDNYPAGLEASMFLNKFPDNKPHHVDSFLNIIKKMYDIQLRPCYNYCKEENMKKAIDSVKLMQIRNKLSETPSLSLLFDNAVNTALTDHHSNNLFEWLVGQLVSLEKELQIKQGRLPNRACGNDNAPKIQDYTIASIALKTANLKLFLSAHRYVIAGRFIDYPDSEKPTVQELDYIHVNPENYFMGTYLSSIGYNNSRWNCVGKCNDIYCFKSRSEIEAIILHGISNNKLDNFNRLCLAQLYATYCFNEKDKIKQEKNILGLNEAISNFPGCIKFSYAKYIKTLTKSKM